MKASPLLQSEQAVYLLDLGDLDQQQPELLALLVVGRDRVAEDIHEGGVFRRRQRPHHAALLLAARRERREERKLQEVEALQGKQGLGAQLRFPGVQTQRASRHCALEPQAVSAHTLDRLALRVQRPLTQRCVNRLDVGAIRGGSSRERNSKRPGSRNKQVRRAIMHLREHRCDAGDGFGIGAEFLRQATDQRPESDARYLLRSRSWIRRLTPPRQMKNSDGSIGTLPFSSVRLMRYGVSGSIRGSFARSRIRCGLF